MIACFDGQPVTAAEVTEHLRPVEPADHALRTSAQERALQSALRVRVFAAEAIRLKLAGGDGRDARSRAMLHQAMVRYAVERAEATADHVSLDEARSYYQRRPGEFNKITGVWVRGIFLRAPEAESARIVFEEVRRRDEDGFAEAAREMSQHPSAANGGDLGDAHADGIAPEVRRVANDLRAAGDLLGPVALGEDRWLILRASRVEMTVKPFEEVARDVQHAIARRREAEVRDGLAVNLSPRHRIVVYEEALAALPSPPERRR